MKDYSFDTTSGNAEPCKELFCPVYSAAATADPLVVTAFEGPSPRNATELYLAVGLDSGLQAADARRKPLNLVILLDFSGSMGSPFDQYYYDRFGKQINLTAEGAHGLLCARRVQDEGLAICSQHLHAHVLSPPHFAQKPAAPRWTWLKKQ